MFRDLESRVAGAGQGPDLGAEMTMLSVIGGRVIRHGRTGGQVGAA